MQHQMTKGTVGPQTSPDLPEGIPMHEAIAALAYSLGKPEAVQPGRLTKTGSMQKRH